MEDNKLRMREIYKSLIVLAVPIVCQNFITYGVTLADNLMVGRLGEAAINGLFMAAIVQLVLQMVLGGVESAMAVIATQYWGRKDIGRIKDVFAICFRMALCLAIGVSVITFFFPTAIMGLLTSSQEAVVEGVRYLRIVSPSFVFFGASMMLVSVMRSVEVVRIGLINSIIAFFVNIFLNYLLIFGNWGFPEMGVVGAALATVISRMIELFVALFFVFRIDNHIST